MKEKKKGREEHEKNQEKGIANETIKQDVRNASKCTLIIRNAAVLNFSIRLQKDKIQLHVMYMCYT